MKAPAPSKTLMNSAVSPSSTSMDHSTSTEKTFPFFSLPGEIRIKILSLAFAHPYAIDLDRTNHKHVAKCLRTFTVSRAFHAEAYHVFFSTNEFQVFPTHSQALRRRTKPILAVLSPRYRAALRRLSLRLGPNWNSPPACWKVNRNLGLQDCVNLRRLDVFAEVDPSLEIFEGFRIGKDFYTAFSASLLKEVMAALPNLHIVSLGGRISVKRRGQMMRSLEEEVKLARKKIEWNMEGPDDWEDVDEKILITALQDLVVAA
ncbi:hypothetical protein MMC25_003021 [Agyrium rufum]|nr:hypothetical protein [Agyrium rufum]